MAPQKTIAASQQEQIQQHTTNSRQGLDQSSKQRKRKSRQSNSSNSLPIQNQTSSDASKATKQQTSINASKSVEEKPLTECKSLTSAKQQQSPKSVKNDVVSAERVNLRNKQANQVPKQPLKEVIVPNQASAIVKKLSTEEPDDIDAGIELDGSSNSGSSVKDISEEQNKSASVSPIMAQSSIVENCSSAAKHAIEVAPVEQLAGSLCTSANPTSKKASSTTMQKLAANQQVIEEDEQQLQRKLRSKQREGSMKISLDTSAANNASAGVSCTSNNVVMSPQSPALCKICEQHVYQMERIMAEKAVYHKGCFRCNQCKVQLRMDNYSSHEGQVYCKAHHRQIFQPQVKLDNEDDVDIVAKSKIKKRQMIICENEPAELPKDVIRSDTKLDDGIEKLNLNLNNILEKFERGSANSNEDVQPSSGGVIIEKPSFDIKKTLMAFETNAIKIDEEERAEKAQEKPERRAVKKLTNLNGLLNNNSTEGNLSSSVDVFPIKPLTVKRSESLMMRLKKYESRINGEQVDNDGSDEDGSDRDDHNSGAHSLKIARTVPKKLTSLKNQWENGDISRRRQVEDDDEANDVDRNEMNDSIKGGSPSAGMNEELIRIRQQLARKKSGESASIKNIYENAIKEAQQQKCATKLNQSDLSALNGFSTTEIQQQLLQNGKNNHNSSAPSTPNKDHFQLNLNNKANKLKKRFEQGLINNNSIDDSDASNADDEPTMSKLEQIRQEKLEDLSIFTEGEIKSREARSMFQQIDRRLSSASNGSRGSLVSNPKPTDSISASMSPRLQSKMSSSLPNGKTGVGNGDSALNTTTTTNNHQKQPIRLTNNVRT